jgi:hypothetical protein
MANALLCVVMPGVDESLMFIVGFKYLVVGLSHGGRDMRNCSL